MLNKKVMVISAVLALSLTASTAFAAQGGQKGGKPGHGNGQGNGGTSVTTSVYGNGKGKGTSVTQSVYGKGNSVTDSVYGKGHNGAHGLLNAYGNVHDKPAGERIANKLQTKYGIDVTIDENTDLTKLPDTLEAEGNVEAAADVQAELVLENPEDIEGYKKLGKLKKKLGHKGIGTYVNGVELQFDVQPVIEGGRTLVPFRAISEALDAEVSWDPATKTVTVTREGIEVKIVLGSKTAIVNGKEVTLETPGSMKNNRVLVPLRFLSEALDAKVVWEPETQSIVVLDPNAGTEEAADQGTEAGTTEGTATN